MASRARQRLVVLNVVLLGVLAMVSLSARVGAQPTGRARGNYTMVSGRIQGATTHCVYLLDSTNQELVAMGWDRGKEHLFPIGFRSLTADSKTQHGAR